MTNRFLIALNVFCTVWALQGVAYAQNCSVVYEEASKMRKPEFGSYSIWSMEHGEVEDQESYSGAVLGPKGAIIVAGERYGPKIKDRELIVAQIESRGRIEWEETHPLGGLERVVKILPHKDGFLVVADIRAAKSRDEIWIGFFSPVGQLTAEKIIADKKAALHAFDIIPDRAGKKYLLAATMAQDDLTQPASSILYTLDVSGKKLADKAFVFGSENRILSLNEYGDDGYVATGYNYGEDGRKNGWIMRLDHALGIMWQQAYPRGAGATIVKGVPMLGNRIAVVGTSSPAIKGGLRAGWVMLVEGASGVPVWQRFYSSDVHYAGRDIKISKDGIISVVLDGDGEDKSGAQEHAQLITLNPRGVVTASDVFYNGEGVDVYEMIDGPAQERILIGTTMVKHQIAKPPPQDPAQKIPEDEKFDIKYGQQGWVLAASPVEPYKDPCAKSFTFLP